MALRGIRARGAPRGPPRLAGRGRRRDPGPRASRTRGAPLLSLIISAARSRARCSAGACGTSPLRELRHGVVLEPRAPVALQLRGVPRRRRAQGGGRLAALRKILPSVVASAHRIGIPMPGHAVGAGETAAVEADCERLRRLVEEHDVVFLLTDTRESRWLDASARAEAGKIAINAALGFDSLMVMRHGWRSRERRGRPGGGAGGAVGSASSHSAPPRARLLLLQRHRRARTCSMLRRTLDQQCTVSRPGLSMVASNASGGRTGW